MEDQQSGVYTRIPEQSGENAHAEDATRKNSPSLRSNQPETYQRPSVYRESVNRDMHQSLERKLSQEEHYILKQMKSGKTSYFRYIWAYLTFLLLVAAYSIVMIVEWSLTLSYVNSEDETCSSLTSTNIKLIVFHSVHIGVYVWGLVSSLTKLPRGLIVFLILNFAAIIWRFSLYYTFLDSDNSLISTCYQPQRFNVEDKSLHILLLVETCTNILGIFLGVQLYNKTWAVSRNKNRLSRLTDNSIIYRPEVNPKTN